MTTAPDVSISTNLGGWINKTGVFSHVEHDDHGGAERLLKWAPGPSGRHIELGISEMNLFMLLGQLGLSHDHHGEQLFPIGTVYDPFVLRGLDALVYSLYNDARFIVTGTPSGVTLAPEGGAHQSTITASVGAELPGLHYAEPAYATEVDWLLCDAIDGIARPDGTSTYLRLSTRPVDQAPFGAALGRYGDEVLRRNVLAGGYRLRDVPPDCQTRGHDRDHRGDGARSAGRCRRARRRGRHRVGHPPHQPGSGLRQLAGGVRDDGPYRAQWSVRRASCTGWCHRANAADRW